MRAPTVQTEHTVAHSWQRWHDGAHDGRCGRGPARLVALVRFDVLPVLKHRDSNTLLSC